MRNDTFVNRQNIVTLNFPLFLAKRVTTRSERTFSKLIVRVAIAGIALGLAIMILSIAVLKGFKQEIVSKQRGFTNDIAVFKYDLNPSYENNPFILTTSTQSAIRSLPEVVDIQPIATKPGIIKVNDEVEGVVLKGITEHYDTQFLSSILKNGTVLDFSDPERVKNQIMISDQTASRLQLKVGDDFLMYFVQDPLRKRKFEIVGIFHLGVEEIDKTYIIGDISTIRRLNDWEEDAAGAFEIRVKDFDQVEQVNTQIMSLLPIELRAMSVVERYPEIFQWLALLDVNAQVLLVLMILVAMINIISALLIMILERTQMIGMLKAMGFTTGGIRQVFLYNALFLISFGMALGNILALGLCLFQAQTHFFTLEEASYYMSFVPVSVHVADVFFLNIAILVMCMLALIIPSGLVARISPIKAINFK